MHELRHFREADVPNMPLLAIVLITVVGCFVVWAFTALRSALEEVRKAWNDVEELLGQRAVVVTRLIESVTPRLREDVSVQLNRAHQRMSSVVGPRSTEAADIALRQLLDPVIATMPSSIGLDGVKAELVRMNEQIDAAAATYNAKVDTYEAVRTSPQRKMFAEVFGYEKESRFGRVQRADLPSALDPLLV